MSLSRRQAAGLLTAGATLLPSTWAQAQTQPPLIEAPDEPDAPPTMLDAQVSQSSHLLAPVTINNSGPYNFLLDTGANVSCVSQRLVERLALQPGPPTRVHTAVGVRMRPSVVLNSLQVGERTQRRVRTPTLPIDGGIDGILGVDWLKGQRLVLDFRRGKIEIAKSEAEASTAGEVVVSARRRLGQLTIVDADLGGEKISAMIGSGAHMSLCNEPLRQMVMKQERGRGAVGPPEMIRMETLAGEAFQAQLFYLPFLRLGGLRLGNVPVAYSDMHIFNIWGLRETPALVLGLDLLRQFDSVALDFGRSRVRFDIA
jgi:predicted aspartyl protease